MSSSSVDYELLEVQTEEGVEIYPVLCSAIPLQRYRQVAILYSTFRDAFSHCPLTLWQDEILFPMLKSQYRNLLSTICPTLDVETLTPASRHRFFIHSDPVSHPDDPNRQVLGLSGIERLLGYALPSESRSGQSDVRLTTGRSDLDVMTRLLLSPAASVAPWLVQEYGLTEISRMVTLMNQHLAGSAYLEKMKQEKDRERYRSDKSLQAQVSQLRHDWFSNPFDPSSPASSATGETIVDVPVDGLA